MVSSHKRGSERLNERIEAKVNDKTPTTLKTLTFHAACDEWFEHYKLISDLNSQLLLLKAIRLLTSKEI